VIKIQQKPAQQHSNTATHQHITATQQTTTPLTTSARQERD